MKKIIAKCFFIVCLIFIFTIYYANNVLANELDNFIEYAKVSSNIYSNSTIFKDKKMVEENSLLSVVNIQNEDLKLTDIDYVGLGDVNGIEKPVPIPNNFKCYESYMSITSKSSPQYKLEQVAYTGDYGIRTVDGRYLVALGTYYTSRTGQYFDVIMENGSVIPCMLGDVKSDAHTDANHQYTVANKSVIEFIVSIPNLEPTSKRMGELSYACKEFQGNIKSIIVYDKNYFDGE